ncbi:glutathione S-transferase [Dunaliella salina]|uniref:glutathione transferase n=1 Tax=Dunaliella salina TaxID=3046 RepID=A0ABQ7G434_DUNSA|nr:glutathione S-transferase [Dunaliella salina]|eukprot:KAF5829380.1 glutathione S-transferase [Dunaliella salina]
MSSLGRPCMHPRGKTSIRASTATCPVKLLSARRQPTRFTPVSARNPSAMAEARNPLATEKPVLHYWPWFRGKGDPIRMALWLKGIEWEDKDIPFSALKHDQSQFAFFQAPAFEVNGRRFWQMNAILRHLGRTQGLYGKDENDMITVDMCLDTVEAMWVKLVPLIYWEKLSEESKASFYKKHVAKESYNGYNQGAHVDYYEWFVRQSHPSPFITGGQITIGDIALWWGTEMMMRLFKDEIYKQYPLLSSFYERFAEAPGIREYLKSPRRPAQQHAISCG